MRVLSFSYFLPYEGVPHAGGEYYLRHIRALLAAGHDVTLVVPATPENRRAAPLPDVQVILVEERRTASVRVADSVAARLRPTVLPIRFTSAVLRDPRVLALVEAADLLEFQWVPASAMLRPLLRRTAVSVPSVCIAHDVVSQSLVRLAGQEGTRLDKRWIRRLRAAIGRFEERRQLRGVDAVVTFSAKDRALLRRYGIDAEVIHPPLADPEPASPDAHPSGARLLFVGAFDRIENVDAADWLLREIWPRIRAARPDARLDLVGAHPTTAMLSASTEDPAIHVSGYVEDLQPCYAEADLALVPLRLGAGVKFKVVTAMVQGVPVVATSVGAEGIADRPQDLFVAVEDEAAAFADAVVRHLDDPRPGRSKADAARTEALERYGSAGFQRRLDALYGAAARGSRAA